MPAILAIQEPGAATSSRSTWALELHLVGEGEGGETEKKKCGSSEALDKTR